MYRKKERYMKKGLENIVAELKVLLEWNSGVMFGLHEKLESSETDSNIHELKQAEKTHKKLYEALIIVEKLLKGWK
jgi:hypothetical protein